mmetsp:Transcript_843/g.1900  ORF Transcript_843/g.1900 Transcript_843/m.1900 type:complete len:248 (-) Transcript_843:718-1461(-)
MVCGAIVVVVHQNRVRHGLLLLQIPRYGLLQRLKHQAQVGIRDVPARLLEAFLDTLLATLEVGKHDAHVNPVVGLLQSRDHAPTSVDQVLARVVKQHVSPLANGTHEALVVAKVCHLTVAVVVVQQLGDEVIRINAHIRLERRCGIPLLEEGDAPVPQQVGFPAARWPHGDDHCRCLRATRFAELPLAEFADEVVALLCSRDVGTCQSTDRSQFQLRHCERLQRLVSKLGRRVDAAGTVKIPGLAMI